MQLRESAPEAKSKNTAQESSGVAHAGSQARVTLAIVPRERFSMAVQSLENVLRHTRAPFELVYVDAGSPPSVQAEIAKRVHEAGGTLLRTDEDLSPNSARNRALLHVQTEYVVFMDNDVTVEEGWLGTLIACADATGAAVVGPLTLIDTASGISVHLVEGTIEIDKQSEPHRLIARHERMKASRESVTARQGELEPRRCDFAEFHTMLVRRSVLDEIGPLDEDLLSAAEHIDLGLSIAKVGHSVYSAPRAVTTYVAPRSLSLAERRFFMRRWGDERNESSLNRLAEKWQVDRYEGVCEAAQTFLYMHQALCPLPDPERGGPDHHAGIVGHGYAQTPAQLYQQMREDGWSLAALVRMQNACDLAITLFAGLFRACGKPFLCHGIGTASILIRYKAPLALVEAGLLHAAYSHGRYPGFKSLTTAKRRKRLRKVVGQGTEALIDRYNSYDWKVGPPAGELHALDCRDAGIFLLRMANDLEEQLDLALAYTAKPPGIPPAWSSYFRGLAKELGVEGLATELEQALSATDGADIPDRLRNDLSVSYSIEQWTRKREPVGRRRKILRSRWRRGLRRLLA